MFQGFFMYVTNQQRHGHLVNPDQFETDHTVNELFNIFENPYVRTTLDSPVSKPHWTWSCFLHSMGIFVEFGCRTITCSSINES